MKKILLTLIVGLCVGSVTMAQEPTKTAKQKAKPITRSATTANSAAKVQAKEARAKAFESGITTQAQAKKAAVVAEKAN